MRGAFASAQGPGADAEYSPRAWLIHKTGVTKGAAMAYTAWVRRAEDHPRVFAALAAGDLSESEARLLCQWTNQLPEDCRDLADDEEDQRQDAGTGKEDEVRAEHAGDCAACPDVRDARRTRQAG